MEPIAIGLLIASLLLAAWLCLPEVIVLCRWPCISTGFDGGPKEATASRCPDVDEDLFEEFAELGFEPVGVYWERAPFGRTFRELIFAHRDHPGFGMLYPNNQIGPRRAAFLTVFTDGAVVFTKNYQGGVEADEEDFWAGVPGKTPGRMDFQVGFRASVEDVWREHRRRVGEFVEAGHEPVPRSGQVSFLEIQRLYHKHPVICREFLAAERLILGLKLGFFGLAPGALACWLGPTHPAVGGLPSRRRVGAGRHPLRHVVGTRGENTHSAAGARPEAEASCLEAVRPGLVVFLFATIRGSPRQTSAPTFSRFWTIWSRYASKSFLIASR